MLALKVSHPRNLLRPRQTRMIGGSTTQRPNHCGVTVQGPCSTNQRVTRYNYTLRNSSRWHESDRNTVKNAPQGLCQWLLPLSHLQGRKGTQTPDPALPQSMRHSLIALPLAPSAQPRKNLSFGPSPQSSPG